MATTSIRALLHSLTPGDGRKPNSKHQIKSSITRSDITCGGITIPSHHPLLQTSQESGTDSNKVVPAAVTKTNTLYALFNPGPCLLTIEKGTEIGVVELCNCTASELATLTRSNRGWLSASDLKAIHSTTTPDGYLSGPKCHCFWTSATESINVKLCQKICQKPETRGNIILSALSFCFSFLST